MNKLIALIGLLLTTATISANTVAEEAADEPLYIESAVFILNIKNSAPGNVNGTVLATPCTGCAPISLRLDKNTLLYINGTPAQYDQLGLKIDWEGSVFYMPSRPPVVTELFLNQN